MYRERLNLVRHERDSIMCRCVGVVHMIESLSVHRRSSQCNQFEVRSRCRYFFSPMLRSLYTLPERHAAVAKWGV
jgi:hypothetical protein